MQDIYTLTPALLCLSYPQWLCTTALWVDLTAAAAIQLTRSMAVCGVAVLRLAACTQPPAVNLYSGHAPPLSSTLWVVTFDLLSYLSIFIFYVINSNTPTVPKVSFNSSFSFPQIEPLSGLLEGGTMLTISGSNLGQKAEDILYSVSVAGVACTVNSSLYEVSSRYTSALALLILKQFDRKICFIV